MNHDQILQQGRYAALDITGLEPEEALPRVNSRMSFMESCAFWIVNMAPVAGFEPFWPIAAIKNNNPKNG